MQSIASILGKEATFVGIFNEATCNNHQFGGYPNEQYQNYMRYGHEFMAKKWGNETIIHWNFDKSFRSYTPIVMRNVNVWQKMLDIANERASTVEFCFTSCDW